MTEFDSGALIGEQKAREAVEDWLDEFAPGYPDYSIWADGGGWGFCVSPLDTTSYLHDDFSIEWYGTGWPDHLEYDDETGNWREVPSNAIVSGADRTTGGWIGRP